MGEDGDKGDTGKHPPAHVPSGMPRSSFFDGAFFTIAIVLALAFLIVLFFLQG